MACVLQGWTWQMIAFLPSCHHMEAKCHCFDLFTYPKTYMDLTWELDLMCYYGVALWMCAKITKGHVPLDKLDLICFSQVFLTPTWTFLEERSKVLPLHHRSYRTKTPITVHPRPTLPFPHPWKMATRSPMVIFWYLLCLNRYMF